MLYALAHDWLGLAVKLRDDPAEVLGRLFGVEPAAQTDPQQRLTLVREAADRMGGEVEIDAG